MILHYLGLDHIGHVEGPRSSLVPGKLKEMGDVIKTIEDQLYKKENMAGLSPAVVVVGDHGMADGGGHGGSSKPEILVPFVLLQDGIDHTSSPKEDVSTDVPQEYLQVDVAPTLAFLTG